MQLCIQFTFHENPFNQEFKILRKLHENRTKTSKMCDKRSKNKKCRETKHTIANQANCHLNENEKIASAHGRKF